MLLLRQENLLREVRELGKATARLHNDCSRFNALIGSHTALRAALTEEVFNLNTKTSNDLKVLDSLLCSKLAVLSRYWALTGLGSV